MPADGPYVLSADPTVTEDINSGYSNGAMVLNESNGHAFILVDNSAGAADWQRWIYYSQRDVANGVAGLNASGELVANIIVRTGTTAELSVIILALGELAYDSDTGYIYKGDGSTGGGIVQPQTLLQFGILTAQDAVNIGPGAGSAGSVSSIAIGDGPTASGTAAIAMGANAVASGVTAIALGSTASATATGAIQIGAGTNGTANSIQIRASGPILEAEFGRLNKIREQTLTDGANISWDADSGHAAVVTLGGSRTLDNPTNLVVGTMVLRVVQDGTGSRTLAYGSAYKWSGGTAPTLTLTGAAVDLLTFYCDGTNLYGGFLGAYS